MKKILFVAIFSCVSVFCATAATNDATTAKKSSVTAHIAGVDGKIDIDTNTLAAIYNLMPQKVKELCLSSYKSIAPRVEKSAGKHFVYEGVTITPVKTASSINLKFSYKGHSLVVKNYTKAEFDRIFGL
ncbi:MAG: hypothetical protein IJX41_09485 [Bacteroidaceae bacterium]|nr:hypothetical protein [Bacteroidaceae bacterium]